MKKLLAVVAAAAALSFGLPGAANAGYYCNETTDLIRSINTDREETIGKVTVMCDGGPYIIVVFDTRNNSSDVDGTWDLLETNAYIGSIGNDCSDVPQNKNNNPQPGKFNTVAQIFKISDGEQMSSHVYGISGTLPPSTTTLVIAAHAMVRNQDPPPPSDNAWGDGIHLFGGKSGATCFTVAVIIDS